MPMHVLAVLSGTPGDAVVLRGSMRGGGDLTNICATH